MAEVPTLRAYVAGGSAILTKNEVRNRMAGAFALACAAVCLYSMRRADPDFWGYLSYGKLFVEHGGVTFQDPFAYTSQTFQWVTFEYGAHLAIWLAYLYGGALGLIALKTVLGGTALYFLYRTFRLFSPQTSVWIPVFLLCASGISRFFLFRPQLFTFAFFAIFVFVLFQHLLHRTARLWVLPIVTLAWANVHGGFVAGLGALGLAILLQVAGHVHTRGWNVRSVARTTRALWLTFGACMLATLVNPLGPRMLVYVATELTHGTNRRYIREWSPASFSNDPWSMSVLVLLSVLLLFVTVMSRRQPDDEFGPPRIAWALSCVPLIGMSFLSVRHVPLAAIWAGPVVAMLGAELAQYLPRRAMARRGWFFVRGLAIVPACLTFAVVYAYPQPAIRTDGPVLGRTHPCRAVAFLRSAGIQGRMYNPLWWGSYVTWNLYPDVRVSMDGRNISLYSDAMVLENMKFYRDAASEVDTDAPLRYDSDLLLMPSDSPVLQRIASDPRWQQLYRDPDAVIFERSDRPLPTRAPGALLAQSTACSPTLE
jgi:hypothetical protein